MMPYSRKGVYLIMDPREVALRAYLKGLETGDVAAVIGLFSRYGTVSSPLYGDCPADVFYRDLFRDTLASKLTLRNIFLSHDSPLVAAVHFEYCWTLKGGPRTTFECVDILEFEEQTFKINHLTIIYDTGKTKEAFEQVKGRSY